MHSILNPYNNTGHPSKAASLAVVKKLLILYLFFLTACSNLPENIRNPPSLNIQINQVLQHENDYTNSPIRWGGTIINVENEAQSSKLQIMAYPLNYYGRPVTTKSAYGRFIAVTKKFLDPVIYAKETEITVAGVIQKTTTQLIGKKAITLPLIVIKNLHVWPKSRQSYISPYDYDPYFYDYRRNYYYPYNYYRGGFTYYGCY